MNNKTIVQTCSWLLGAIVLLLAGAVWASERLNGSTFTAYDLFPLLGLSAFSLMWTHYVLGALRRHLGVPATVNKTYFAISSVVVLLLIILHPGILIAQLYKDGFGLPPHSYLSVYSGMEFALALGTTSLIIFLLFEFKKRWGAKAWWRYVEYAQIAAMGFIFYHGLTLGRELSVDWYRTVWYLYGVTLVAAVLYNYWYDRKTIGGTNGRTA